MAKFFDKFNIHLREFKVYQNAYYWFIAPLAVIFIALVCGAVFAAPGNKYDGFANIGVDFKGGTVLTVEMVGADLINTNYDQNVSMISDIVKSYGAEVSSVQRGGNNSMVVRYANSINGEDYNVASKTQEMISINNNISNDIKAKLISVYGSATVNADAELINATASSEFLKNAFLSIGLTLLITLIYILIRFDIFSSVAALLAIFHDIIITLACVIIFNVTINSSLIAALITVIGFSINNTIVVFDRVRENIRPYKTNRAKIDVRNVVNTSVADTLTRSLFTILTTLITIAILAFANIPSLEEFALPIIFGLIAGLYSSVFVAPAIWGLMMQSKIDGGRKQIRAKAKYKKARA